MKLYSQCLRKWIDITSIRIVLLKVSKNLKEFSLIILIIHQVSQWKKYMSYDVLLLYSAL